MGCFSFMFADSPREPLFIGEPAYLICPDGSVLEETAYDGYGRFCGEDVYELVVDWNRAHVCMYPEKMTYRGKRYQDFKWFPVLADSSVPTEDIAKECFERGLYSSSERFRLRNIGIDIACYDEDNESLAYPIKICKTDPRKSSPTIHPEVLYLSFPASKDDPGQGMGW